jgi:peptidoglycan/LPS O-acetylase OafA/YrhL
MNSRIAGFFAGIKTIPAILQNSYYPSLNGLRGIAILMVLFSHLKLTDNFFYNTIFSGPRGVNIFFVLSGFLITTLCIKEKAATGDLSLKNFYIRRALRIFPVAYLFIVVLIILNFFFHLAIHNKNFIGTSLYLMDFSSYFRKYYFSWYTGHFWSLSVEEQFYLIIPFILKRKFKVYLLAILSIVFILPLILSLQYIFPMLNTGVLYAFTHFIIKFQAIAVGCLFSVLMFKYSVSNWFLGKGKFILNILSFLLILLIPYDDLFNLESVFTGLLISILIGCLIVSNISPGNDLVFKFLNTKILNTIGILSYSIYIWQQIFTSGDKKLPGFMVSYPFNILCIIIVSCCSYYFFERTFLKLKSKFSKVKATSLLTEQAPVPTL